MHVALAHLEDYISHVGLDVVAENPEWIKHNGDTATV